MSRESESGPGVIVVWVICMALVFAYFAFVLAPAQDRCEARGGEPIVDRFYEVRCVEPAK